MAFYGLFPKASPKATECFALTVAASIESAKFQAITTSSQMVYYRIVARFISIDRSTMSSALKRATGSIGTVSNVSSYRNEIEDLLGGASVTLVLADDSIEDPAAFVMEKHLEDFLVQNWAQTEVGKEYDIYEVDGELVGQQYMSDTGPMDVLAISKDKKRLLVVELKRGRASDVVVGQILRYMGYVKEELADVGQTVQGAIIGLEDDPRIRRALAMVTAVEFYRYQISFKLVKA